MWIRIARLGMCLAIATALWLPTLHLWFGPRDPAPLVTRQLELWRSPPDFADLRRTNPEWDLMARMFDVLAFANLALDEPARRAEYLAAIDRIIDDTVRAEREHGMQYFLLPYWRRSAFVDREGRSLFVDGELAMMLAARQLVERDPSRLALLDERVVRVTGQIERSPLLVGESYPDEVWLFCNAVALAAVRLRDAAAGKPGEHDALMQRWVASARTYLVDDRTGLLVSKATLAGVAQDGPEGSTIWLVADMLLLVDRDFATDQYQRARRELRGELWGFSWAREWPASWPGREDIDSGPTIPIVGANAGSSGLALIAARAFHDDDFTRGLLTSLDLAGFPIGGHYAAGNQLADSVILYAVASGPLWERVVR
jgi:hypothetical protein